MSHTSRSYQFAPKKMPTADGTGETSSAYVLTLIRLWCATDSRLYTICNQTWRDKTAQYPSGPTSNRIARDGKSTAVMSMTLLYWHWL